MNSICPSSNHQQAIKKKVSTKFQYPNKKLTMGLNSYKEIKQAHLKNHTRNEQIISKDTIQCTFQPNLNQKNTQRRSLKKFLEDQNKFANQKSKKIKQLRAQINKTQIEQFTGRPSIDRMSQRISTNLNITSVQVFDRLSKQKKMYHEVYEQEMFSPKILQRSKSLHRKKDIANLLYQDAIRRKQKQQFHMNQLLKKQFLPNINKNTNELVIKKIFNEFIDLVSEEEVSPITAITILSQIFNIDLNPNKSQDSNKLCQRILSFLVTKSQMVNSQRLWNFIQTIVNGHLINSDFNEQEQGNIIQSFSYFYNQRLTKQRKSVTPEKNNFKPKTLRSSQKLAENYRQKTVQAINQFLETQKVNIQIKDGTIKIQDLFIIEKIKKEADLQKKRIQKANSQLKECSFKPNLNLSSNFKQSIKRIDVIVPKSTKAADLKKQFKLKNKENKENKENLENQQIFAEKYKQDRIKTSYCENGKLKTSASKSKLFNSTLTNLKPQVKNMDKSVMRMTLGRKNRQFVNTVQERGYPQQIQNWNNFKTNVKNDIFESTQRLKGYSTQKSQRNHSLRRQLF